MPDLLEARSAAYRLATSKYKVGDTTHTQYSSIYMASTSNVKDTMNLYDNFDSVLALGGTGAHGFEAALHGAKKIDLFDINYLQEIFFQFMLPAITYLPYEDFVRHFTLKEQHTVMDAKDFRNLLSYELWEKLAYFVPEEVEFVLGPVYEMMYSTDIVFSALFRFEFTVTLARLKRVISFYNKEEYEKLQKILRSESCEINYHICSVTDVPKLFKGNKYNLIILDNVLQYYKDIPEINTPYQVNQFIDKKLSELLTEDGVIQAAYGYEIGSDATKKRLGMPYKTERNASLPAQFAIEKEIKEGICNQLINKWDHYSYNFIDGVEKEEFDGAENVVITYKKKIR